MSKRLERALEAGLRIRPGEQRRVALMAAYAANAIGAVVVGRSVRDALYLAQKSSLGGAARGLAGMYVYSSVAIVLVSYVYARFADRVPRGALNAACALGCGAVCAGFWALLQISNAPLIYAALYIFVEAMGSLVVIQFWTMANDVFHAREAKRLFGLIGGGGTLANVIFGLLVGRYAKTIGAPRLLWLMVGQLALCALLARAGARLASVAPGFARRAERPGKAPLLSRAGLSFFGNRHLTIVALIGAVSAAAVTIVDFQFKLSATELYRDDAGQLAGYFGSFYGVCGGVALAIQIWVTGRVLERFGILASLLPLPLGLGLGSAAGAIVPVNPVASSLAKGSDTIFRYTINDASMQLLYVPVQPHVRGRAKAFIDGVLKPTSIALTGLVLFLYKEAGFSGRPLTAAVLLLVVLWVVLLVRARAEYVSSLVESLERRHLDLGASTFDGLTETTLRALRSALRGDVATVLHALTLVQQHAQKVDFAPELRDLLRHPDARVRATAVQQLGERRHRESVEVRALLSDPVPEVRAAALGAMCAIEQERAVPAVLPFLQARKAPEAVVRAAAAVALIRHAGLDGVLAAAEPLKELLGAEDPRDRAAAADALGNIGVRGFFRPLLAFLRDPDPMVRRRAIAAAGKLRTPELIPSLIEQFQRRETALEAASALAAFGPGIEAQLAAVLIDEGAHVDCRRGIALVLQRLGTPDAVDALLKTLTSRDAAVRKAAARALSRLTRRQRGVKIDHAPVDRAVHAELDGARVALATLKRLALSQPVHGEAPRSPAELLTVALLEERDARILQALLLLEVLLPDVRLDVVAENLRSESAAARGNAIEVLDNALPDPWKRLLMAALDEVKRRGDQVAPDPRTPADLLAALIGGESGAWVAACAARWAMDASDLALLGLVPTLQIALHSPSAPLRQAAALALAHLFPADAPRLLVGLAADPAPSVARVVQKVLQRPRATG